MKLRTNKKIYIGMTGSGKSFEALRCAIKNKGTTIIVNGCVEKYRYEASFPELEAYEQKDGRYNFKVEKNGKYFLSNTKDLDTSYVDFAKCLIKGCDYGKLKDDSKSLVVFDDMSWAKMENKLLTLWQFAHVDCGVIITAESIEELLGIKESEITNDMIKDLSRYYSLTTIIGARGKKMSTYLETPMD